MPKGVGLSSSKLAVITGAGAGIGRAPAEACDRDNDRLALGDRATTGALGETAEALSREAIPGGIDGSDRAAVQDCTRPAPDQTGTPALVVHHAGLAPAQRVAGMDSSWN